MALIASTRGAVASPQITRRLPLWRAILFRVGLVLSAIMGLFNLLNGWGNLTSPDDAVISPLLATTLIVIGLPTLLFVSLAWIPVRWALITLISLRSLEFFTMFLPMGKGDWYDAPEQRPFYLVLVGMSLGVCALMALGLQRRK